MLGKKIAAPEPEPGPDVWEPYKGLHGHMLRNKRTGELRTDITPPEPDHRYWPFPMHGGGPVMPEGQQ